jgi:hypothetical protein
MAATATARLVVTLEGLAKTIEFPVGWSTTSTPTKYYYGRQVQAVADTAEALEMGNITTPLLVVISCVTNDVDIDTSYSASFNAEQTVNEGECAVFCPAGTVYIKNDDASETSTIDVLVIGT